MASEAHDPDDLGWVAGRDYQVVPVDDSRSMLFLTGNHRLIAVSSSLGERLKSGLHTLRSDERGEWDTLRRSGLLGSIHADILRRASYRDGANLAINVNLTAACNLACSYCFADGGDYGRIRGAMGSTVADHIFEFIRRHVTRSRVVRFEFFGGEPLINFAMIREICERADRFTAETGVGFINRISTNLTVMPAGVVDFFRDRRFIVSVSIDGAAATHDRNRPTKHGAGSFEAIIENCRRVRAAGDAVTMVARMTVVGSEPPLIENVRALWSLDLFDFFQIYPGVTPSLVTLGKRSGDRTMSGSYLGQLAELMREYPRLFAGGSRFRGLLEIERIAEMLLAGRLALGHCSAGETYFTFSPDDSIMPCHRMVGDPTYQAGTGGEGLWNKDLSEWTLPVDHHSECSQCWARYVCGGNCRQENHVATGSLRQLNPETCNYQRRLLEEVIRMIAATDEAYRSRARHLDDLFVSCGRPVMDSHRPDGAPEEWRRFEHFRPLFAGGPGPGAG